MRRFIVCFSSLGFVAASIVSGCSSDNATGTDSGTDANMTVMDSSTTPDAHAEAAAAVDAAKEAAPCVPMAGNVATIATGSAQWTCIQGVCGTVLTACAADCLCNNAILGALSCSATGGSPTTCFGAAVQTGGAAVTPVLTCLLMNQGPCTPEAGPDARADGSVLEGSAGGEGGAETGTDAGVDGATDSAVTDAPADGG